MFKKKKKNDNSSEMVERELESMIVKIERVNESDYYFTNNLNFALFSINCLL